MIDGQRQIGRPGLPDRLAVVEGLDRGEQLQVLLHPIGDQVEDPRPLRRGRPAPGRCRRMGRIESQVDVFRPRAGDLAQRLPGDGSDVGEVASLHRRYELAADEIAVLGLEVGSLCGRLGAECRWPGGREYRGCHGGLLRVNRWAGTVPHSWVRPNGPMWRAGAVMRVKRRWRSL